MCYIVFSESLPVCDNFLYDPTAGHFYKHLGLSLLIILLTVGHWTIPVNDRSLNLIILLVGKTLY